MINGGDLKWIAKIEQKPAGKLPSGALNEELWQFIGNRRVKIEEITGSTESDGTQRKTKAYYRVEMRYMPTLTATCRLTIKGRTYGGLVMTIENLRRDMDSITLTCVVVK